MLKALTIRILSVVVVIVPISPATAHSIQVHFFGNAVEAGYIAIDGRFEEGLSDQLQAKIDNEGIEARRVLLNSPGGSLQEGILLGQLIRKQGWSTEVGRLEPDREDPTGKTIAPGECFSACALAFLGGSYREPRSAPSLGFHQFHEGDSSSYTGYQLSPSEIRAEGISQAQVISGLVVTYMVEMGVDARLFSLSTLAESSSLIRFTIEQAMSFGVVTPYPFGNWILEPYRRGVVAASKRLVATGPYDSVTQSTIFCRYPNNDPSIMMTAKKLGGDPAEAVYALGGHDVNINIKSKAGEDTQTFTVPSRNVKTFISQGRLQIEVGLSSDMAGRISQSEAFGVVLVIARAYGGYRVWHELTERDRMMIDAAFRLCI